MKKLLYLGIVLMFASCNNNNHCGNGVQDGDETGVDCGGSCVALCPTTNNNNLTPTIGEYYQGGLVFYLDGNGGGLIAAPTDLSGNGYNWGVGFTDGATDSAIGTGYQNTIDIVNADLTGYGPWEDNAGIECANLTLNGYSDWFLPSIDELTLMYLTLADPDGDSISVNEPNNVGNFAAGVYWSSTGTPNNLQYSQFAWARPMGNWSFEREFPHEKILETLVRPVRAF